MSMGQNERVTVGMSARLPVIGRQATYLVLGGALLLPFGVLGSMTAAFVPDLGTRYLADGVLLVLVIGLAIPAFGLLHPVQQLELTAAQELLSTPALPAGPRTGSARRRVAAWFTAHVLAGALGSCALLAVPLTPVLIADRVQTDRLDTGAAVAALLGVLLAGPGLALLLGRTLATLAPRVLGPSAQERMELLQAQAGALAQRARLAREVHDSVGHALSVVTLQAAAARHVFDRDPEFARTALGAVEDTARAALIELDHVLGLLAEDRPADGVGQNGDGQNGDGRDSDGPAVPSLTDLDDLFARTRLAGVTVDADLTGARANLPQLPAELSRQAYRMVQEAVTNAVRHGDGSTVRVRLEVTAEGVLIDVHNPLPAPRADAADHNAADRAGADEPTAGPGGRGLIGLRGRVSALGGSVTAGPVAPRSWQLVVQLPLETAVAPTKSRQPQG